MMRGLFAVAAGLITLTAAGTFHGGAAQGLSIQQNRNDRVEQTSAAIVRVLDKISGSVRDVTLAHGRPTVIGRLAVSFRECRYPSDNPVGEAFGYVEVFRDSAVVPVFSGWMVASSPAFNALDDQRYDVWLLRCQLS